MRKGILRLMVLLLAAMPFLGVYAGTTQAATSRVAVIKSMSGTVQVKKAGGSKQFKAFTKMSLNEGDVLSTDSGASAVLQFANGTSEDDQMTVSAKTTLTFSKLSDRNGTRTKVTMFNGTSWVDVKSISTKNDEFTLETPTAVMGVRGTHFFVNVDPLTGSTSLVVAAGKVKTETPASNGQNSVLVYPSQQIDLSSDSKPSSLANDVNIIDVTQVVSQASPEIIKKFIESGSAINEENNQLLDQLKKEVDQGKQPDAGTLTIKGQSDLDRLTNNLNNLLGALVKEAVDKKKIETSVVQQILDTTKQKLDYINANLQITDEEKKKQEALNRIKEQLRQQKLEELKLQEEKRDKELQKKLEEQKKQQEEANKKALEDKQKKAQEAYEKQLSDAEKKRFQDAQNQLNQGSNPSPSPVIIGGGGGSTYISPLQSLRISYDPNYELPPILPDNSEVPSLSALSSSTAPTVSQDVPLTSDTYNYTMTGPASNLLLNAVAKGSEDSIKITVNGVDMNLSSGEVNVPLFSPSNKIVVSVKANGSSTVNSMTLNITRPSAPAGVNWSTVTNLGTSMDWKSSFAGVFVAKTQNSISSMTITPNLTGSSFTSTNLMCISDCLGVTVSGTSVSGLQDGQVYLFALTFTKEDLSWPAFLVLYNGYAEPDWNAYADLQLNDEGMPISLEHSVTSDVYKANVGAEVERITLQSPLLSGGFYLETPSEDQFFAPYGVWNDQKWGFEMRMSCNEGWGACLDLKPGLNTFKIFVTDFFATYSHVYTLQIFRQDLPTGVDSWSASFAAGSASPDSVNFTQVNGLEYEYRYYAVQPDVSKNDLSIKLKVDGTLYSSVSLETAAPSASPVPDVRSLDNAASQPVTFTKYGLSPGVHEYNLDLNVRDSDNTKHFKLVTVIGDIPQTPLALNYAETRIDGYYENLDVRTAGTVTSIVYSPVSLDQISIDLNHEGSDVSATLNGKPAYVGDWGRIDSYDLIPEAVNTFEITLLDRTHTRRDVYKILVYNGLPGFNPESFALTNTDSWPMVDGDPLSFEIGGYPTTIAPIAPDGKVIEGVYDEYGKPIAKSVSGDYTISEPQVIYIVVKDPTTQLMMPTRVNIYYPL